MSGFFGSALTDRSGKFNRKDDFASLALDDTDAAYDFKDTYDGLGDQLEEDGDDLNDDTFGTTTVGKDFDFSGNTANVVDTLGEEQLAFQRRGLKPQPTTIDRTPFANDGRQNYGRDTSDLHRASNAWNMSSGSSLPGSGIWGAAPAAVPGQSFSRTRFPQQSHDQHSAGPQVSTQARKFQTLAEVEAAMLASSKPAAPSIAINSRATIPSVPQQSPPHTAPANSREETRGSIPPGYGRQNIPSAGAPNARQMPPGMSNQHAEQTIGFNQRLAHAHPQGASHMQIQHTMSNQSGAPGTPSQASKQISMEDDEGLRAQQQKNLRRAQKIGHMARYNGIMSNGDKNYVLKVQISQLVMEDPEADDFYYTVHSTLRGRNNVQQSLGHFEQTYLSRAGQSGKRGNREKQNPMLKMQQQVQKIIASAKSRPKSTSLAMEGSLGKLSFSRVRQPKQVLNIKMPEGTAPVYKQTKIEALQNIETVYDTLLLLEHTGRQMPPEAAAPAEVQSWQERMDDLAEKIWRSLHIMDQVGPTQLHPFIQLLQYSKGKKLIPRLYRNLSPERRLALITMIVAHLDVLDVVRAARYDESGTLPREIREEIELFTHTVLPPLLVFTSNAPMKIVVGLLNMLLEQNHIQLICTTKVGLSFMTMFISRAEIAKQAELADEQDLAAWHNQYNRMFAIMEGKFSYIFPPQSHHIDEIYPWQFLAACAVSASPEQQHALVNEARDRVLDNVQSAKALPKEIADIKRSNVNLFLNAIGLDASQLEG